MIIQVLYGISSEGRIPHLVLVFLFAVFCVSYAFLKRRKRKYKFPPGPRGLPLLGNNFQLIGNSPKILSEWANQYGKLYTIHIGNGLPTVVVNDAASIRQIFGSVASTGKFQSEIFKNILGNACGVIQSEGKIWQEQRTFFVKTIQKFGFGNGRTAESLILSEIEGLCKTFEREMQAMGKVRLQNLLKQTAANTLWTIVTGRHSKTNIAELITNFEKALQKASNSGLPFFSWIKYIAPVRSGYNEYLKASSDIHNFVKRKFDEHKNVRANGAPYNLDIIHEYLDHVRDMQNENSSFFGLGGVDQSFFSIVGLLIAGIETVATNTHWSLFYLTAHADVQRKMYQEITRVIGPNRTPSLDDRLRMPYTEAVIEESFRMASSVPFGVIHRLLDDVIINEYTLPKDTLLIANINHVHNNKSIWGDPECFRPERFLGPSGKKLREQMVTFQNGRRVCPGEMIGRDSIFLFLTTIIKSFSLSPESDTKKENYLKKQFGYIFTPKDISVIMTPR